MRSVKLRLLFVVALILSACSSNKLPDFVTNPQEAVKYDPPKADRWYLSNGIEVVFIPNEEIPVIEGTLYIPQGSLGLPEYSAAVLGAAGVQMRAGGAGNWGPEELDLELEKLSATVGSGIGSEYSSVSFGGLVTDADKILEIAQAVLLAPKFDPERLNLWKRQGIEGIRRRTEDSSTVASLAFGELLFGRSVYGKILVSADIEAVDRVDLLKVHRKIFNPKGAKIALSGALTRDQAATLMERYFGHWHGSATELPAPPPVDFTPQPGIYFIDLPFEQSVILMGEQGVPRLTPDYIAIEAFNDIFGTGGFGSRLFQEIRVQRGLAYSAYGAIAPGVVKGKNAISIQTKTESTVEATAVALGVLKELQAKAVSEEKLAETKRSIENAFVFKFASQSSLVDRYVLLDLLKYPADYDLTYLPKLRALNVGDIQQVAMDRWHPDQLVILVVGKTQAGQLLEAATKDPKSALYGLSFHRKTFKEALE